MHIGAQRYYDWNAVSMCSSWDRSWKTFFEFYLQLLRFMNSLTGDQPVISLPKHPFLRNLAEVSNMASVFGADSGKTDRPLLSTFFQSSGRKTGFLLFWARMDSRIHRLSIRNWYHPRNWIFGVPGSEKSHKTTKFHTDECPGSKKLTKCNRFWKVSRNIQLFLFNLRGVRGTEAEWWRREEWDGSRSKIWRNMNRIDARRLQSVLET